ncbi:MAG: nuclear transport factor 2 family protein [Acidimicrobiia bacterium]|nr:nuclear transport factor 2 family protein [Acidimicrobiia bacterium]
MANPEAIRATVDGYVNAYGTNDRGAFLALWADDGVLEDPVGTPAHQGLEALGAFWDSARQLADRIVLKPQSITIAGSEAAMVMEINAHMGDGGMVLQAVDIMQCNDAGQLESVRAFWDMASATPLTP